MKRVLIAISGFPPYQNAGTERVMRWIKYLPKFGWQADIITGNCRRLGGHYDPSSIARVPTGTRIFRTFYFDIFLPISILLKIFHRKHYLKLASFFTIPDIFIGWIPFVLYRGKKILEDNGRGHSYSALISSSPPHSLHLACLMLKRQTKIPWVVDFRDPWIGNPVLPVKNRVYRALNKYWESSVLKACDAVLVSSLKNQHNLQSRYPSIEDKIIYMPNGYDEEDFIGEIYMPKQSSKLIFFHGGTLFPQYDPIPFFKALSLCLERNQGMREKIQVNLYGSSSEKAAIKRFGLELTVYEFGPVSQRKFFTNLMESNIALLIFNPLLNTPCDFWVPAKLYQYLGSFKPILAIAKRGEAKDILLRSGLAVVQSPDDITGIADSIRRFYNKWIADELNLEAKSDAISIYEAKKQTHKLSIILKSVCKN